MSDVLVIRIVIDSISTTGIIGIVDFAVNIGVDGEAFTGIANFVRSTGVVGIINVLARVNTPFKNFFGKSENIKIVESARSWV
jgi:hypothetical protein